MRNVKFVLGTMTFGESVFAPDVETFVDTYLRAGGDELDTAYVYNEGQCEKLLGQVLPKLDRSKVKVSTKVNPRISGKLDGEAAYKQLNESLDRMGLDYVDTFYLHFPDPNTSVDSVLEACGDLYRQGKFRELGLSNFPAWMVADVWHKCDRNGWVKPTVYEGIYNPLTRNAETELNRALDHFGMRFYAYNPTAGGLLTGRYKSFEETVTDGRFTHRPNYQGRYWKKSYFDALDVLRTAADSCGITLIEAVYRWLCFHSMLNGDRGDAILVGASKLPHLQANLNTVQAGPLPEQMIAAFEKAWATSKADSPDYFTFYKGNSTPHKEK